MDNFSSQIILFTFENEIVKSWEIVLLSLAVPSLKEKVSSLFVR